jgi:hypothetical protein
MSVMMKTRVLFSKRAFEQIPSERWWKAVLAVCRPAAALRHTRADNLGKSRDEGQTLMVSGENRKKLKE